MSAGRFSLTKYAASYQDAGEIHPIRIQPETAQAVCDGTTNAAPSGDVTNPISALVSRGRRSRGLLARLVYIKSPESGQPTNYKADSPTVIPALTEAFYNKCAVPGATVSYLGSTYVVTGVSGEVAR